MPHFVNTVSEPLPGIHLTQPQIHNIRLPTDSMVFRHRQFPVWGGNACEIAELGQTLRRLTPDLRNGSPDTGATL